MMRFSVDFVLLVDDDQPTNYFHRIILEDSGKVRRIEECSSAEAAQTWLSQSLQSNAPLPDLIFLDINMPGMSGWDFLETWDALPWKDERPQVVMLTTSINPDDRDRGTKHPALAGFCTKPLTEEMLARIVLQHMPECIQKV